MSARRRVRFITPEAGCQGLDRKGEPSYHGDVAHHRKATIHWKKQEGFGAGHQGVPSVADWMVAYHELMVLLTNPDSNLDKQRARAVTAQALDAFARCDLQRSKDEVEQRKRSLLNRLRHQLTAVFRGGEA